MPENIESELVSRFKAGDLSVFNMLTRMWYSRILGFLYRTLGDMDEAQDVCQKTFIAAYSRLHKLNKNDKFSTWLYSIAYNLAIDEFRSRKKIFRGNVRQESSEREQENDPPDAEPEDLAARIDGAALHHLFEKVMRSIPEEQRVVVVMKLYQDLKFTEIAGVLDVPVNTVKTRMYSGLRTLKEALSKNKMIEEILKDAM